MQWWVLIGSLVMQLMLVVRPQGRAIYKYKYRWTALAEGVSRPLRVEVHIYQTKGPGSPP
jgi:hypothetical protein